MTHAAVASLLAIVVLKAFADHSPRATKRVEALNRGTERTNIRTPEHPVDTRLILSLDCVTAGWPRPVLENASWNLRAGELWALVGPNGAGKSSLLRLLRGQIPITRGELRYGQHARGRAIAADPVGQVLPVSFAEQAGLLRGAAGYTQSRWHAGQDEAVPRGRDVLGSAWEVAECHRLVVALRLEHILDRRVTELSNGERRKLVLARAAGRHAAILALDNPFGGLDGPARTCVSEAIDTLHQEGMTLVVSTSREDEIPKAATHLLVLDRGRVVMSGPREAALADEGFVHLMRPEVRGSGPVSRPVATRSPRTPADRAAVVELREVHLTYGKAGVLRGLSWTVRRGERWVVVGPNGAGKSALLSLILADNPQAYANDVSLFGRRRGSGETIWEIRRRIGCVSPEMHLYEELHHRVVDVIGSGFRDPTDPGRPLSSQERRTAEGWVAALDLERRSDCRLSELSEGERQTALLGRALAKGPDLLVLDEPCQGLDARRRALFLDLLERELRMKAETTLIYVTHDLDEVPSIVSHGLLLREGRCLLEGPSDEVLGEYRSGGPHGRSILTSA